MSSVKRSKLSLVSIGVDLLIDLILIVLGVLIYYHFMITPLGPFDISPVVGKFLGGRQNAVLFMAGVPAVIGIINLLRTVYRVVTHGFRKEKAA